MASRKKRPSAADYLADLEPEPATPRRTRKASPPPAEKPAGPAKVRATYYVEAELVERARNAAVTLMGPPHFLTLSALVEAGVRSEVERLEKLIGNKEAELKAFQEGADGILVGG